MKVAHNKSSAHPIAFFIHITSAIRSSAPPASYRLARCILLKWDTMLVRPHGGLPDFARQDTENNKIDRHDILHQASENGSEGDWSCVRTYRSVEGTDNSVDGTHTEKGKTERDAV